MIFLHINCPQVIKVIGQLLYEQSSLHSFCPRNPYNTVLGMCLNSPASSFVAQVKSPLSTVSPRGPGTQKILRKFIPPLAV